MTTTTLNLADTAKPVRGRGFRGYIAELDALRAFGITMVIAEHTWPHDGSTHRVWDLLNMSWILMDSFFVLSGFLIAGNLLDTKSKPDFYSSYYARRALRILPLYYLLIGALTISTMMVGAGNLYLGDRVSLTRWGSPWWFFAYLGNLPVAITGTWPTAGRSCYVPLWSLQIEEQFYLLFPFLVKRCNFRTLSSVLLGLACVSTVSRLALYWVEPSNALIQYVFLPCRMEGLAFGAWIALRFRERPWKISRKWLTLSTVVWVSGVLALAAWSGYRHTMPFNRTIGLLISPIACAHVVLWLIVFRDSKATRALRLPAIRHIGKISYCAYLVHMPVAAGLIVVFRKAGVDILSHGYFKFVTTYVATILISSLSWRFLESPLLKMKDRLFPTKLNAAA